MRNIFFGKKRMEPADYVTEKVFRKNIYDWNWTGTKRCNKNNENNDIRIFWIVRKRADFQFCKKRNNQNKKYIEEAA